MTKDTTDTQTLDLEDAIKASQGAKLKASFGNSRAKGTAGDPDYFPTPPWATRALIHEVIGQKQIRDKVVWEPACGEGHMSKVLREFPFAEVLETDKYSHNGYLPDANKLDFLEHPPCTVDWIITNPPFNLSLEFVKKAMEHATHGVAILQRLNFLEGKKRCTELFWDTAPSNVAVFSERVPMVKGRLDRKASTATPYAWYVWHRRRPIDIDPWANCDTTLNWIPGGTRKILERDEDYT